MQMLYLQNVTKEEALYKTIQKLKVQDKQVQIISSRHRAGPFCH